MFYVTECVVAMDCTIENGVAVGAVALGAAVVAVVAVVTL